jgi:hypothetical protein
MFSAVKHLALLILFPYREGETCLLLKRVLVPPSSNRNNAKPPNCELQEKPAPILYCNAFSVKFVLFFLFGAEFSSPHLLFV